MTKISAAIDGRFFRIRNFGDGRTFGDSNARVGEPPRFDRR